MKRRRIKGRHPLRRRNRCHSARRFIAGLAVTLFIISSAISVSAQEDRVAEGAKEITFGIASIPRDIADTANESNILKGIFVGGAKGIVDTGRYISEGFVKILTFSRSE